MPIPEPKTGQEKQEYIGECIGFLVKEGRPQDQATAICYDKWENYKNMKESIELKVNDILFLTENQKDPSEIEKKLVNVLYKYTKKPSKKQMDDWENGPWNRLDKMNFLRKTRELVKKSGVTESDLKKIKTSDGFIKLLQQKMLDVVLGS